MVFLDSDEREGRCPGVPSLLVEFSARDEDSVSVTSAGESILLTVDGRERELSRADAAQLQEALGAALTEKREFFRTAGEYREDGCYVVSRRGADSSGNAKVFDSFDALCRLYQQLPEEFTAEDVGRTGITGSRRHMVVRHFGEHPVFDCEISRRNPLTVRKEPSSESESTSESTPKAEAASSGAESAVGGDAESIGGDAEPAVGSDTDAESELLAD